MFQGKKELGDALDRILNSASAYSYGHGVLRNPDPRFIALQEFCETRPDLKNSPIVDLVQKVRF